MQLLSEYIEGKQVCLVITWLLNPLQCLFPVVSLSDGCRRRGHEPGCGFSEPVYGLYQVDSPEMFNQEQPGKLLPSTSWSSQTMDTRRTFKCKPFYQCFYMNSLSKGFVELVGNISLKWSKNMCKNREAALQD